MKSNSDDEQSQRAHGYDQRQYRRVLQRLEAFEADCLFSAGLVGDLTTLLLVAAGRVDECRAPVDRHLGRPSGALHP